MVNVKQILQENFKTEARTIPGFMISALLFWLLLHQSHFEWKAIRNSFYDPASLDYFLFVVILFVFTVFLHSLRTRIIFIDSRTSIKNISAYSSLVIGNLYNCLLPGNLGEGVRAVHFSRINNIPFPSTLAVFVVEKVIDANLSIPLFLSILAIYSFPNKYWVFSIVVLIALVIALDVLIISIITFKRVNRFLFGVIPNKIFRKFTFKVYFHFKEHCTRMWHYKTIFLFIIIAYSMFFLTVIQYFYILKVVKIGPPVLSITSGYFLSICMIIISFVPSAPGNIGVAHYGIFAALILIAEMQRVPIDLTLTNKFVLAGICLHLSYFIPEILIGTVFMIKERKRLF